MLPKDKNIQTAALLAQFQDYFRSGLANKHGNAELKVGAEFEHFVLNRQNQYLEWSKTPDNVQDLMNALGRTGKYHNGESIANAPINLSNEEYVLSLEPGAQLEVSLRAAHDLKTLHKYYRNFVTDFAAVDKSYKLLATGINPLKAAQEIELLPKRRYILMDDYFRQKAETAALLMMRTTASLQVCIDYYSERDFCDKYRLASLLSDFFYMLSANCLFYAGHVNIAKATVRRYIWRHFDKRRTALPDFLKQARFGFGDYIEYLLNTPIMFNTLLPLEVSRTVKNGAGYIDLMTEPTAEESREEIFNTLLSYVFPPVRLKAHYLELRMFDAVPYPLNFAFIALVKGLFNKSELVATFNEELAPALANHDYRTFTASSSQVLWELTAYLLRHAAVALPESERIFLEPLKALLSMRTSPLDLAYNNLNSAYLSSFTAETMANVHSAAGNDAAVAAALAEYIENNTIY